MCKIDEIMDLEELGEQLLGLLRTQSAETLNETGHQSGDE